MKWRTLADHDSGDTLCMYVEEADVPGGRLIRTYDWDMDGDCPKGMAVLFVPAATEDYARLQEENERLRIDLEDAHMRIDCLEDEIAIAQADQEKGET